MKNRIQSKKMTICRAFHQAIASLAERETIEKTELVAQTHSFCLENSNIQQKQIEKAVHT